MWSLTGTPNIVVQEMHEGRKGTNWETNLVFDFGMLSNPVRVTLGSNCFLPSDMVLRRLSPMSSYAKKRRLLRDHRVQMRVMEDLLHDAGLEEDYNTEVMLELGNAPFYLGFDDGPGGMDESSATATLKHVVLAREPGLHKNIAAIACNHL